MLLQNFSGGLFTRLDSRLSPPNFGVIYHNIDNQTGNIESIKDDLVVDDLEFQNFHWFKDKLYQGSERFLEYKDKLIKFEADKIPQKTDGNNMWYNLGIKESTTKLSYQVIEDEINETITESYATDVRNFYENIELHYIIEAYNSETEVYSYKDLYYTTKGQEESYIESINFSFDNNNLTYKIYRYYNRKFQLVADETNNFKDAGEVIGDELEKKTILSGNIQYAYTYYNINDGSESRFSPLTDEIEVVSGKVKLTGFVKSSDPQVTHIRLWRVGGDLVEFTLVAELSKDVTEFIDDIKNEDLSYETLRDDNLGQAKEFNYMTEYNNMLFGIRDTKLYFSDVGNMNAWSPYNFIDFPDILTGIGATPNGLLVFTKYKTYIVTGNSPETLNKFLLDATQGCISNTSIQSINGICLWASTDGICASSGGPAQIQTIDRLGKLKLKPLASAVYDNVYYLSCDDKTYALDTRFNEPCIRTLDSVYTCLQVYDDTLYGNKNQRLVELFNGLNNISYHYKSPKLTEGLLSMVKNYKVIYVYSKGDNELTVYIDGNKVINKKLQDGLNEIKIPQPYRLGYYLELELTGTGIVYEIEYKAEGRQNGR